MNESYVGQVIGNWRILEPLGEGAFGAVYKAESITIVGRRAAVKFLHEEHAADRDLMRRFLNESSAASRAEHENIIQVFDGGVTDRGVCFSVMELLDGRTLSSLLNAGPIGANRTINIALQIASGLSAAHKLEIVHRDLKPDNILIVDRPTNPEFVKILDFGIAKLRTGGDAAATRSGLILGTPGYIAPEQWLARKDLDGRADIYSLGIILYQCMTGRFPFSCNNPMEWMRAHLELPVPDLPGGGPMNGLIQRMVAKERDSRPAGMLDVMADLHAVRGATGVRKTSSVASTMDGGEALIEDITNPANAPAPRAPAPSPAPVARSASPPPRKAPPSSAVATVFSEGPEGEDARAFDPSRGRPSSRSALVLIPIALLAGGLALGARYLLHARAFRAAVADGDRALAELDWDGAVRAFTEASVLEPEDATLAPRRFNAEREAKNKGIFEAYTKALQSRDYDGAIVEYDLIPADSAYRKKVDPTIAVVRSNAIAVHLDAARGARCDEAKRQAALVLQIDPNNFEAQDAARRCSREPVVSDDEHLLTEALGDYVKGDYLAAIAKARKADHGAGSARAWRIIGASSCYLKDRATASTALSHVDVGGRQFLTYACSKNNIELP